MFDNCLLYLRFRKPNTKDDFETLAEVAPGENFAYDFPGAVKKKEDDAAV